MGSIPCPVLAGRKVATRMRRIRKRSTWQRVLATLSLASFAWSAVLAQPLYAQTHQPLDKHLGVRPLSPEEMKRMFGSQTSHPCVAAGGEAFPWQGNVGGVNT